MSIATQLASVQGTIPEGVELIAVSKTHPVEAIREAYDAGHRAFGENRVQEFLEKVGDLPKDVQWHLIGHLQRNKVKMVVGRVALIHSVDSPRLLEAIDREAQAKGVCQDILLQAHVAQEQTKFGFAPQELKEYLQSFSSEEHPGIRIRGLMGMATFTFDEQQVRTEFRQLKQLFDWLTGTGLLPTDQRSYLSMGMSGDYHLAIDEGSTMVRVGSAIFGTRQ
ncbi:MAG: YggS family pyridoxal phosphate-dependent enzyme [Bacteroidetes bacterium]|nr:MAG: YggS family pyridoxal phosphate-dependent enzyme [Bacteroidota bacterium]